MIWFFYIAHGLRQEVAAWDALLPVGQFENLAYSIGVTRIRGDGQQVSYNGISAGYGLQGI